MNVPEPDHIIFGQPRFSGFRLIQLCPEGNIGTGIQDHLVRNSPCLVLPPRPSHMAAPENQPVQRTFPANGKLRAFPFIGSQRSSLVKSGSGVISAQYCLLSG